MKSLQHLYNDCPTYFIKFTRFNLILVKIIFLKLKLFIEKNQVCGSRSNDSFAYFCYVSLNVDTLRNSSRLRCIFTFRHDRNSSRSGIFRHESLKIYIFKVAYINVQTCILM